MKTPEEIKTVESQVWNILKFVIDPEIEVNIVDMGLVYKIAYDGDKKFDVNMTLSTPACPIGDAIMLNVKEAILAKFAGYEVDVQLVFDPPWTPDMVSEAGKELLGM
jgi:metal-sulfur cluster biosynthetic enzyme